MEETAEMLKSFIWKKTVFVVTHDLELILKSCTHVMRIDDGKMKDLFELDVEEVKKLKQFFT